MIIMFSLTNTPRLSLLTAFALSLSLGTVAHAKKSNLKDDLTVSGRFEFPQASPKLYKSLKQKTRLEVDDDLKEMISKLTKLPNEQWETMFIEAFDKSLLNYGYMHPDVLINNDKALYEPTGDNAGEDNGMTLKINSIDFKYKDEDTISLISLSMLNAPDECLNTETKVEFKALKRVDTQKTRKALGILATGFYGQIYEAKRLNQLNYYEKKTAVGEGYPPKKGKKRAQLYAMKNAMRLNFAHYIARAGNICN